jgi:hypothetical protein
LKLLEEEARVGEIIQKEKKMLKSSSHDTEELI